jgi:transposase
LEQRLSALQPLELQRRLGAYLRDHVGRSGLRVPDHRFHDRARTPACQRRKRGAQNQALGRSRGGLSTKVHLAVRGLGCPVRFILTAGQAGDAPQAGLLLDGAPAEIVIADTAYDADHIRNAIAAKGAEAVIPNNPSRARKYPLDAHLYAQRHLIECCFSKLKQFRRVATRFEKTAQNYLAIITIAATILWLR